jgi:hypothetical protein
LEAAEKYADKLDKEVKSLVSEVQKAENAGIPTHNLRTMRDVADGNAGMARNEVKAKKTELERLKGQMNAHLQKR